MFLKEVVGFFNVYFRSSIDKKICFPFVTDDDHRVVLKSISGSVDCEHNYINAAYVDVSSLKNIWPVKTY